MELISLSQIRPGGRGTIKQITGTGTFFTRLRAMGVRHDADVSVVRRAPFGGALHIRIGKQCNIALPIAAATQIMLAVT